MGVNIRDVAHAIQWKISDHLVLVILLQRIGRIGYNKTLLIVFIIFIAFKYVLPNDIALIKNS